MIEHESHSHAHHTGLPWLDLIIAGSAIFISIISLIISIQHGHTMEKLVAANEKQVKASTLPILHFATGNALNLLGREKIIHFDLSNGGTGPAIIEWLRIKWNGQPANGPYDLLDRCCDRQQRPVHAGRSDASGLTLPAGQSLTVFRMRAADAYPALYDRLNTARYKIEPEACYCSVLDECWITDFKSSRPRMVKACEPIPESQRW
jgi:hypothetical protein